GARLLVAALLGEALLASAAALSIASAVDPAWALVAQAARHVLWAVLLVSIMPWSRHDSSNPRLRRFALQALGSVIALGTVLAAMAALDTGPRWTAAVQIALAVALCACAETLWRSSE